MAVLTVIVLAASACSKGQDAQSGNGNSVNAVQTGLVDEGTPQRGGVLVTAVNGETNGWNPATAQWVVAGNIVGSTMYEPLLQYNSEGELAPWLAESVTADNDVQSAWTIKLRKGIMFHDGTEMNASAVAQDLNYAMTDGLASVIVAGLLDHIDVIDNYTLDVKLAVRWAQFPNILDSGLGLVWAPSMLDKPDKGAADPIGTGPYKFDSWIPDKSLNVRAFDGYWGGPCKVPDPGDAVTKLCQEAGVPLGQANGPWLDSMQFRPITDPQQRADALKAGDVNLIETSSPSNLAELKSNYQVVTDFNSDKTTVMLNTTKPPLDNVHVRRALAHATDRQALADTIGAGEHLLLDSSPISSTSPWGLPNDQTDYPAYDLDQARQELDAYKADTGQSTVQISLLDVASTEELAVDQQLVDMWRQVGIDARINTVDQSAFITTVLAGDYHAAVEENWGFPDPDTNYPFWSKETAEASIKLNFTRYWTDTTQRAVTWGRTATAFDVRKPGYDALVRDRNENVADMWLFNTPYTLIGENNIRGLNPFRGIEWGNFVPKPLMGGLWIDPTASAS